MILLDTHVLLWWLTDDDRLTRRAREEIRWADGVLVSAASGWEIATKHRLGKLGLGRWRPADLPALIERAEMDVLSVALPHALEAGALASTHRDPFDRLLCAQSRIEAIPIVTGDPVFAALGADVIW